MIVALFVLLQPAAAPSYAPVPRLATTEASEKKVCRKRVETGSLVRQTKVCRTQAEWRRTEEDSRAEARFMQNNPDPN